MEQVEAESKGSSLVNQVYRENGHKIMYVYVIV